MTEHQRQHDLDHDSNYHQDTEHDSNYQPAPQGDAPNYQPHAAEDHHDGAKEYAGAPEADRFEHGTDQGVVADGDRVVEVEEVEIIEEEGRA